VDTFVEGPSSSPKFHEMSLPLFVKIQYGFLYLVSLPYGKIFLEELMLHLSPRNNGIGLQGI